MKRWAIAIGVGLVGCGGSNEVPASAPAAASASAPAAASATAPASASASAMKPKGPETPKHPVIDLYRDVKVTDDYRWLEDWNDPAVKAWSDAENQYARAWLDAVPARGAIHDRIEQLVGESTASWGDVMARPGVVYALERKPPKQHPYLIALKAIDDASSERVVFDPNAFDATGGTAIDFVVPSHDGKKLAISLSKGGSESGDVHVIDAASGKELDVVPRVNGGTAGGSLAWAAGDKGFYYTRYPRGEEKPAGEAGFWQQVWFHPLGADASKDTYAIGKDGPRIAEWQLEASDDGRTIVATMKWGDGGETDQWVLAPGAKAWTQVAGKADRVKQMRPASDGKLYLLSTQDAPRGKVLRTPAASPKLASAEVVVPQGGPVIDDVLPTKSRLFLREEVGGVSRVASVPLAGKDRKEVAYDVPPVAAVNEIASLGGDDVAIDALTFTTPRAIYEARGAKPALTKTPLASTSRADFSNVEVTRETCTSKDGTAIPITILHPKGAKLDGSSPALLTGYGGFALSQIPRFRPQTLAWLEQGGVYAVANIRGGGEFGDVWHDAGKLERKQNVFDDFYACAQHLVDAKYTTNDRLAIEGGSNGGLLMGAELTQHPEAFKAVVTHVGIYDMLRVERDSNGAFNVTEYGSVNDPKQFAALYAYSPYHHVKDGTAYPATLFMTGANDPRVNPYHSRKMVARLQAATSSDAPILLRTSADTGHGIGSPLRAQIDELTDVYAFLFRALGIAYRAAPSR